eukprot:6485400-Amphidinium_carterae.1
MAHKLSNAHLSQSPECSDFLCAWLGIGSWDLFSSGVDLSGIAASSCIACPNAPKENKSCRHL